ncbi:hypothetical protein GGP65_001095 [Salinibacter ruber]|uniref:hypothetical protein n=1 Tax=Salinibacter ruber TaxID=146919 RepID=UPI002167C283|nr:hypothetical protein [Salinibacter ruber]MCS3663488.1 hypothetical protein [Salinibacter ruber]
MPGVIAFDAGVTIIKGHQLFGVLLILSYLIATLVGRQKFVFKLRWKYILPLIFLVYIFFSWTRSIALSGDVLVFGETMGNWGYRVANPALLEFGAFNITQSLYPIYGVLVYYVISASIDNVDDVLAVLKSFVYGSLVVAAVQIGFGILYTLGMGGLVESVYALLGMTGYSNPPASEVGRMILVHSLAGEPGTAALMYLSSLSFLMLSSLSIRPEERGSSEYAVISILFVALLFTGSTLSYFGLIVLIVIFLLLNIKYVTRIYSNTFLNLSKAALSAGVLLGAVWLVFRIVQVDRLTVASHAAKLTGSSSDMGVRWKALYHSIEHIYTHYPLFGVGYGSHISPIMADALMVNTGIVGVTLFVSFVALVVGNSITMSIKIPIQNHFWLGVASMNIIYFVCVLIGVGAGGMGLGPTWLLPALAAAVDR